MSYKLIKQILKSKQIPLCIINYIYDFVTKDKLEETLYLIKKSKVSNLLFNYTAFIYEKIQSYHHIRYNYYMQFRTTQEYAEAKMDFHRYLKRLKICLGSLVRVKSGVKEIEDKKKGKILMVSYEGFGYE